jgi:AP-2 complex subunit mu-1
MYTRQNDVYIVALTRKNANPMVAFEFLIAIINVFTAYFGTKFVEDAIRNNFVVIYELLDEMMDNGYPQLTALSHLKGAISLGSVKGAGEAGHTKQMDKITSFITGGVDWREAGKHFYKKNEVFMDVLEAVNVLMSADGTVLRSDVSGKIVMKTYLSGMPECQFGLNDKLLMDKETERRAAMGRRGAGKNSSVAIDDLTFHRCVSLAQFDQDRTVSFVPPDGEFTLMKYRVTNQVQLPFAITPSVTVRGRTRVEYEITLKGNFDPSLAAVNVKVMIPVPHNTASANVQTSLGAAKHKPMLNCIQWKIPRFAGNGIYTLRGEAILAAAIEDKPWAKPPITLEFQVPMYTASGLRVRFLKVVERSQYEAVKWVRYMTRAGNYAVRI